MTSLTALPEAILTAFWAQICHNNCILIYNHFYLYALTVGPEGGPLLYHWCLKVMCSFTVMPCSLYPSQACKGGQLRWEWCHSAASHLRPWYIWFQWLCWPVCYSLQGHPPPLQTHFRLRPQCCWEKEFDSSALQSSRDHCIPGVGDKAPIEWSRCDWLLEKPEEVHGKDICPSCFEPGNQVNSHRPGNQNNSCIWFNRPGN